MASHWIDSRPAFSMETDVLVVGAGAAGVAAACTVARQGLRVTLLERYGFCGGAAVAGLSGTVCGLFLARRGAAGKPEQVVHGFVDRFIEAMRRRGGLTDPVRYGETWTLVHEPYAWRETGDELLAAHGVEVLYHATVTGVYAEGGERIEGVRAFTKQGPLDIRATITIDASGDADLFAMANLETCVGVGGKVQNPTMIFRIAGVDKERFLANLRRGLDPARGPSMKTIVEANTSGLYYLPRRRCSSPDATGRRTPVHTARRDRPGTVANSIRSSRRPEQAEPRAPGRYASTAASSAHAGRLRESPSSSTRAFRRASADAPDRWHGARDERDVEQ